MNYAVEKWLDVQPEIAELIGQHWKEIALNQNEIKLDPAWEKYASLAESGSLHTVTVRDGDRLVGYHLAIITGHLHYQSTLHGITDIYWLLPEYRKGYTGVKLFRFVEQAMREAGVKLLVTATKKHLDMSPIFVRLGYKAAETVFKKILR